MSWSDRTLTIQVGDRVAYSRKFLQSIGSFTGDLPFARGTVTEIKTLGKEIVLATINWDDQKAELPERVNVANLCLVGRIQFER